MMKQFVKWFFESHFLPHIQFKKLSFVLFSLALFFRSEYLRAGACHPEPVSFETQSLSHVLAGHLRKKVIELDQASGGDNEVFILARAGQDLAGLDVMIEKDPIEDSLQTSFNQMVQQVIDRSDRYPRGKIRGGKKLKYSHMAFLFKRDRFRANLDESKRAADWIYVSHLLAECDSEKERYGDSDIFYQTLDQFFFETNIIDKKTKLSTEVLIAIPEKSLQKRIYQSLHDRSANEIVHQARYNAVAAAFRLSKPKRNRLYKATEGESFYQLKYQNSNQWPLELMTLSWIGKDFFEQRRDVQQVLKHKKDPNLNCSRMYSRSEEIEKCEYRNSIQSNYRPSVVFPNSTKSFQACSLSNGFLGLGWIWDYSNLVNCDDQGFSEYKIMQLISVDSVIDWMKRNKLLAKDPMSGSFAVYDYSFHDVKLLENIKKITSAIDKAKNSRPEKKKSSRQ